MCARACVRALHAGGCVCACVCVAVHRSQCKTDRAATVNILLDVMKETVGWFLPLLVKPPCKFCTSIQ